MAQPNYRSLFAALIVVVFSASESDAATFRVTTRVFEGAMLEPFEEHRIMFDNGLVYDLPQIDSRYVTVFDEAQSRVVLLDRENQVQTTVGTDFLIRAAAKTRADATTPKKQESWGLNAQVSPSNRVIGYTIRFGSLEYHTTTQKPEDPSVATDYARFAILASRLNIVRGLGPPPFGRMTLCEHIASKSELPLETTLSVRRGEQTQEFRSTHALESLSEKDRDQIKEVRGMLELYRSVEFRKFPH